MEELTFKKLREQSKKTIKQIIDELDISESSYTKYESSFRIPSAKVLINMSKVYKCSDTDVLVALRNHFKNKSK